MAEKSTFLTREGMDKLKRELVELRTEGRLRIARDIRSAKEGGDIMENAAYDEAKAQQALLEWRISTLERILDSAVVIDEVPRSNQVVLGSWVTIQGEDGKPETFRIVGSAESDPVKGLISNESPLGKALLGHRVGDEVKVKTPGGLRHIAILDISHDR